MQREMGAAGGVVMEGRDIGTNVFPDAEVKIFLAASAEERADRRVRELAERGQPVDWDAVLADQRARDERDSRRELNPLIQAPDAVLVDTTNLTIPQVVDLIARLACGEHPCQP
jgi:cytidylate kinase